MKQLVKKIQAQVDKMCATGKLFRTTLSRDLLWDTYYSAFPEEFNPVFRDPESSTHNCNNCKNFIRNYGDIVAFDKDLNLLTIWDIDGIDEEYNNSVKSIRDLVRSCQEFNFFIETFDTLNIAPYEKCTRQSEKFQLGMGTTYKKYTSEEVAKFGVVNEDQVYRFDHLHTFVPSAFIDKSGRSKGNLQGEKDSAVRVFNRGLIEIQLDTLEFVIELIQNNSILNGSTYLEKVEKFAEHKKAYDNLPKEKRAYFAITHLDHTSRFKNDLIGTLCLDIQTVGVEKACLDWNKRVDPVNYKRASAPISKAQIKAAQDFIVENGYEESFDRRCATLDDISAHEILHMNETDKKKNVSLFDNIVPTKTTTAKAMNFDKLPEVEIDTFMKDILPSASKVEIYLTNELENNFVTLTTSSNKDSKRMFQWGNNFSWTYNGNLSGKSAIKQAVKTAGGFVDAPFRFSIMWNEDGRSIVDLDAHCITPKGQNIYYGCKLGSDRTELDIDMINPPSVGVENIFNRNLSNLMDGNYKFYIDNFNGRSLSGFKAEIEVDGEVFQYEYNSNFNHDIVIATVTIKSGKLVSIDHELSPTKSTKTKEIYGLNSNEFHDVNLVCKSPNHWDGNNSGNLHYFFMIKGCKCETEISTFHTEYLNSELTKHRKVIQLLANTTKITCGDDQLSGIGFNATMNESTVIKVTVDNKSNIYKLKI